MECENLIGCLAMLLVERLMLQSTAPLHRLGGDFGQGGYQTHLKVTGHGAMLADVQAYTNLLSATLWRSHCYVEAPSC